MKKIVLLLLLYLFAYSYAPQIQASVKNFSQSAPFQQTVASFDKFLAHQGVATSFSASKVPTTLSALTSLLQNAWQNTLGKALQVVSVMSSDNPALEKSMRILERHLQLQMSLHTLPSVNPTGLQAKVGDNITLYGGDSQVSEQTLKSASALISDYSLGVIQNNTTFRPTEPVTIVLYSNAQGYGDALLKAGISPSDLSAMLSQTGGITVNSSIWIPLYNLQGKADLANVLTHELTHVAFNQAGIGTQLPLWMNEGTSWANGLAAQEKLSPRQTQLEIKAMTASLKRTAQKGELLPLSQINQGLLNANYNVEFQGYLATEQLLQKHGLNTFKSFLSQVHRLGVEKSFLNNFGQSLSEFEKEFKV